MKLSQMTPAQVKNILIAMQDFLVGQDDFLCAVGVNAQTGRSIGQSQKIVDQFTILMNTDLS